MARSDGQGSTCFSRNKFCIILEIEDQLSTCNNKYMLTVKYRLLADFFCLQGQGPYPPDGGS